MKGFFPIALAVCAVIGKALGADIEAILAKMDIKDKVGQMVQLDIQKFLIQGTDEIDYVTMQEWIIANRAGSMLNAVFSGGPINGKTGWNATEWRQFIIKMQTISQELPSKVPIIYGLDSIHGATYVKDAALFPQSLGAAASFDRQHVKNMGIVAAKDTRAAGVPWLFAPVLGLGLHPLWSRFAETFGEDMYLAAEMGVAAITGMQEVTGDGGFPRQAAACMKHFIAYSDPENGHDRSPVMLPDRSLRQLYLPMFRAAIKAGINNCRFKL
jgi:beta-glucosidase